MNRWKMCSISLALVMGLVALAPIHMLAWDTGDSGYIDKIVDDSDQREGASEVKADSNTQANNYDGVDEEDLELIKKKLLGRAPVVDPPEDSTE
ncbi:MAG: hypothetical protein ACXAB4_06555 [Candidatus Hodarchaeales archaeon]|jgi:hypothetical protein